MVQDFIHQQYGVYRKLEALEEILLAVRGEVWGLGNGNSNGGFPKLGTPYWGSL